MQFFYAEQPENGRGFGKKHILLISFATKKYNKNIKVRDQHNTYHCPHTGRAKEDCMDYRNYSELMERYHKLDKFIPGPDETEGGLIKKLMDISYEKSRSLIRQMPL